MWLWSLAAIVPLVTVVAYALLEQRMYYTGTDSVGVRSIVGTLAANQRLCIPDIDVPGGTGAVQLAYAAQGPMHNVSVTIRERGRISSRGAVAVVAPSSGVTRLTIPVSPALSASPQAAVGTVCITTGPGAPLALAGFAGLPSNVPSPTIAGHPTHSGVALWFLPPHGATRSLVSSWSTIMHRLTLFRPGFAGVVFYWLLFLLGLPLLVYFSIRLLAVAGLSGRRLVLGLAIVGFFSAALWAVETVPFDSPDESEHFAYTESLIEAGRAPDASPGPHLPYATDETFALDAVHHFGVIEFGDTRYPWFTRDQSAYTARVAADHPSRANGGGFSVATQAHSPLYYVVLAPGYELGHSGGTFTELFWMRLVSALLGAVVVVAAYGTVREIVPSRPELAVLGALLVAMQPMFSFISGAVNNDVGVNALAAVLVYLTVRMLRRGLTWRLAMALGICAALTPIMKGTGEALLPAVAISLVAVVAIRHSRRELLTGVVALGSFLAVGAVWGAIAGLFHRSAESTVSGATVASGQLTGKLTYLWEVFLPRLPFMAEHWLPGLWPFKFIYVERGFAAFGWYAVFFPPWVYDVIVGVMAALGLLALAMMVRRRRIVRTRWATCLFLVLVIAGVIAGVEFAFYSATPRPLALIPEQGRYAFTAIVPLVGLAVAGLLLLPRRAAQAAGAVLLSGMAFLAIASHLLYLAQNFT